MEPETQESINLLLQDPDNQRCFECQCNGVQWASVTNGVFICMQCAGRHRGFGVHLSFVRSLTIDNWSEKQMQMIELGGNKRLRNFLNNYEIPNEPMKRKYQTEAAYYYREMLQNMVDGKPSNPPPEIEEGKKTREIQRNTDASYGGYGSGGNDDKVNEDDSDLEASAKKLIGGLGGFFRKAFKTVGNTTKQVAGKVSNSKFGQKTAAGFIFAAQKTKQGFTVAADKTKAGFLYTAEKTKGVRTAVAEKSKTAFIKTAEATKKGFVFTKGKISNVFNDGEEEKKADYFGGDK